MERGKTYTENEMEDVEFLEEEIKTIFHKDVISDISVVIGNMLLRKWKKLTNWKENDVSFLKEN